MVTDNVCRWLLLAILTAGLVISVYYRRRADRAGGPISRRRDGTAIAIPLGLFGLATLIGLVVYLIHPAWMAWSQLGLPAWLRLAGAALGSLGLALFWWVFGHLGLNVTPTAQTRPSHTLVTTGPYRWIRHPMYSFGVIVFAAYFLLTANWFIGLTSGVSFALLAFRTREEEANLIKRFGNDYRAYKERAGRFVPRLRPRRTQSGG